MTWNPAVMPRLGAGAQVRGDRVDVEVGVAATLRGVAVGLVQPRGARAERAVDEQVAGQPTGAGAIDQVARLVGGGHGFAPVADDLDAVVDVAHLVPVVEAADVGACAFVHRDDAEGGRGVERGQPGRRRCSGVSRSRAAARTRWCASPVNGC